MELSPELSVGCQLRSDARASLIVLFVCRYFLFLFVRLSAFPLSALISRCALSLALERGVCYLSFALMCLMRHSLSLPLSLSAVCCASLTRKLIKRHPNTSSTRSRVVRYDWTCASRVVRQHHAALWRPKYRRRATLIAVARVWLEGNSSAVQGSAVRTKTV